MFVTRPFCIAVAAVSTAVGFVLGFYSPFHQERVRVETKYETLYVDVPGPTQIVTKIVKVPAHCPAPKAQRPQHCPSIADALNDYERTGKR